MIAVFRSVDLTFVTIYSSLTSAGKLIVIWMVDVKIVSF